MAGDYPVKYKDAMEALDADLLNDTGTEREQLMELAGQHVIRAEAIMKIMKDEDRDALVPVFESLIHGGASENYEPEEETSDADIALATVADLVTKLTNALNAHNEFGPVFQFTHSDLLELNAQHHTSDQIALANTIRNSLIDLSTIFELQVPALVLDNRSIN